MELGQSHKIALALLITAGILLLMIYAPNMKLSAYSVIDQDAQLVPNIDFTVGDFVIIFSLFAGVCTIMTFLSSYQEKKKKRKE